MDSIEWVMCRPGRYRERRSGVFPLYTRFTVLGALRAREILIPVTRSSLENLCMLLAPG
jgi:hypothetical protein